MIFACTSCTPNMTMSADRQRVIETPLKAALYLNMSAIAPPGGAPINVPVTLRVCIEPRTFPAVSFGVCVDISACDIGTNPVNTPEINRNKKSCHTEVAYPINRTEIASPGADKNNFFFRSYLSPNIPYNDQTINS